MLDAISEIEIVRNKNQGMITSGKEMEDLALQAITKQKLQKGGDKNILKQRNNLNGEGEDGAKLDTYRFQKMLLSLTSQLVDLSDKFRSSFILLGKFTPFYQRLTRFRWSSVHSFVPSEYNRSNFHQL